MTTQFLIFLVLIVLVCLLLVLVVMVQNPKGGGLSSSFGGGGSQVVGGVKKTGDFLDKSTWILAAFLVVLILASNFALRSESSDSKLLNGGDVEEVLPESESPEEVLPDEPMKESTTTKDSI